MVPADGMDELVARDLPQAIGLLREMNENAVQVAQLVDDMLERVKRGELSTAKGLSFLEVKYHMLLSYLINLTYVVLRKCTGEPIEADPAIDRLVELRTVLEKTKPIDHKLKYQVDKLVKAAVTGTAPQNDPTQFKPNPDDMGLVEEEDESENEDKSDTRKNSKKDGGIYVPPRLASVPYDGETTEERQQRQAQRAKIRALSSSMIEELKEEYLDTPLEISHGSSRRAEHSRQQKERQEYEESYFTRLTVTKQDAHKGRRSTTIGNLGDELTRFGDFKALESGGGVSHQKAKKRKLTKYRGKKNIKKKRAH